MNTDRNEMLKQLTSLDFMSVDLQLYLDTHPYDMDALKRYNAVVMQANKLRHSYEAMFGPLTSYRSPSKNMWEWMDNPWPWDYEFNFELAGEER